MKTTLRTTWLAMALAIAASTTSAQCPIRSATFKSYGTGCTSVNNRVPVLAGKYDPTACAVFLDISAYGGCCNTYLRNRIFVFGVTSVNIPMPWFGRNCVLLNSADLVFVLPVASGSTLKIQLPPGTRPGTLYVQGAAHYLTTIGLSNDYQLTNGLTITLQ